jgi:hypothetical protein
LFQNSRRNRYWRGKQSSQPGLGVGYEMRGSNSLELSQHAEDQKLQGYSFDFLNLSKVVSTSFRKSYEGWQSGSRGKRDCLASMRF